MWSCGLVWFGEADDAMHTATDLCSHLDEFKQFYQIYTGKLKSVKMSILWHAILVSGISVNS